MSVLSQFGRAATHYSTSIVHVTGEDLDAMLSHANPQLDQLVLDAGCGAGHTALAFAPHVLEVVAYDLTPAMLEQVRQLAEERDIDNVTKQQGDVANLPFPDATFDLVVSRYSAHHWPHPEQALHEFKRVLKADGRFVLSDIVSFDDYTQDTFLQTIELLRDPSHVCDHSIGQWQTMLAGAGFSSEVALRFEVVLDFNAWVTRMATPADQVTMIKTLWAGAANDVKVAFHLPDGWEWAENFDFVIPGAVLIANPARR